MKTSTYGKGNTKFSKLGMSRFPMTIWDSLTYGRFGCGATALALITGSNPRDINVRNAHYSDNFMVKFLRKNKFSVYEVNKANLSNKKTWSYSLQSNHLILFSSLILKKEASWFVLFNDILFHNFEIRKMTYQDTINFPIDSMYVIYNKKWGE